MLTRLRPVILLLGDSLTQWGFGSNGGNGWASHLSHEFRRRDDVHNRGFSGYNSRHISQEVLKDISLDQSECLFCTVFLGTNDAALPGERQHVPLNEYEANLEKIVNHLRSSSQRPDLPIVLMTPPPVDMSKWARCCRELERDPSYRASEVARTYGDRARRVADKHGCLLLDVFAELGGHSETYEPHLSDGIHLSSSGNDLVYESLLALLESQAPALVPTNLPLDEYFGCASPTNRKRILLLGDSLTEFGFELNGWAARLASDYSRRADCLVRGFQGHNTKEAMRQFEKFLPSEATNDGSTLFATLWLGANDAFPPGDDRHVPAKEFKENLVQTVKHLRTTIRPDLPVILITPPPIDPSESISLGLSSETNRIYADQVATVAQTLDCGLVDLFHVLGNSEQEYWTDGVHLNALGNSLVHEAVTNEIKTKYKHVAPMMSGNGKYGIKGVPLDGKLWTELC